MLTWFRSHSPLGSTAAGLYGSIVAQARDPAFYVQAGVADTMESRFGLIAAHLFLVLERIRMEGRPGEPLARALLEKFMTDVDDNMRELGIGDMGVPRRVKKAAAALSEQLVAYRAALAEASEVELLEAIRRNLLFCGSEGGRPDLIASYMRRASVHLASQYSADVGAGRVEFPALV